MHTRATTWRCLIVLLSGAAVVSSGQAEKPSPTATPPKPSRPNIVIVTFDTLRADHVSAYGYPRATTPRLDALAADGTLFETTYAVSSTTLPSHATLFSSRFPDEHGARKNGHVASQHLETLAERMRGQGYETAAFVSSFVLDERFGLAQGFDHYDDDFDCERCPKTDSKANPTEVDAAFSRRGLATATRAKIWLDQRDRSRPFFLWMHLFDPHTPYRPPPEDKKRFVKSAVGTKQNIIDYYDAEIHAADRALGLLLDHLPAVSPPGRTLTIVTSDHGEALGEHGHMAHGVAVYEPMVRVPLVLHWPGRIAKGKRLTDLVAQIDMLPTLAGLTGLSILDSHDRGHDFSPLLRGEPMRESSRAVFLRRRDYDGEDTKHLRVSGSMHAVRVGRFKLIDSPEEKGLELYDLDADPGELNNLADERPDVVARLTARLAQWRASQSALVPVHAAKGSDGDGPRDAETTPKAVDDEVRRGLEALGYVE